MAEIAVHSQGAWGSQSFVQIAMAEAETACHVGIVLAEVPVHSETALCSESSAQIVIA